MTFPPQPSRPALGTRPSRPGLRARAFVENQRRNSRIGIVSIAATASVVQSPTDNREDLLQAIERLQLQPGTALGSGIYVGNLWYSNFSDRTACRTTGMTRFATFWVENGEIVAPLEVMRFDETLYRMLGANLVGLTRERETILDPGTYYERSTDSARLPGALIDDFTFTL